MQICIVILTVGILVMMLVSLRMLSLFGKAAREILLVSRALRRSAARMDLVTHEARSLVASLDRCVQPAFRVANRLETVGQRIAELSTSFLDEVAAPVFTVAALARGVRAGTRQILQSLIQRLHPRHSPNHGGFDHE